MKSQLLFIFFVTANSFLMNAQCFVKIVSGEQHTVAIADDGTLWGWGSNTSGECGILNNPQSHVLAPTQIGTASDWTDVDCGGYHTLALRSNGDLYSWGYNSNGQLGLGDYGNRYEPTFVSGGWKAIGCGSYSTYAVATNGNLYAAGDNSYNQLGIVAAGDYASLTLVDNGTEWKDAVGGLQHGIALKNDGTLYAAGNNDLGQFGTGGYVSSMTFVQVTSITDFTEIDAGFYHSVGRTYQNYLYSWGYNTNGQVGNGSTLTCADPYALSTNVVGFACGENSTIYHTTTSVYSCGNNGYYQAGSTNTNDVLTPFQWTTISDPELVTMGIFSSSVITSTGLMTWGRNDRGVCGNNTTTNVTSPTIVLSCSPVGIEEKMNSYSIYPNPAITQIIVTSEIVEEIVIKNNLGKIVGYYSIGTGDNVIDVAHLSSGVYFISGQRGSVNKFIKQ